MSNKTLAKLLSRAIRSSGSTRVRAALEQLASSERSRTEELTIIANVGVHKVPQEFLRGEVYEASRGNWNASGEAELSRELEQILRRLVKKLRSKAWKRIYLVPTGHPILSMQIKMMVYRILRLNTVDLYYKGGVYLDINLDQRAIALREGESE